MRSFGQLMNTTADIMQHVQEAVANEVAQVEAEGHGLAAASARGPASPASPGAGALSAEEAARYDGLVHAMQRDSATYCDKPEDAAAYGRWRAGFDLGARRRDVEGIMRGNSFMAELHHRIVPLIVDYDAFWTRYFYRLHCLEVAEGFAPSAPEEARGPGEAEEPPSPSSLPDTPPDEAVEAADSLKGSSLLDEAEAEPTEVGLVAVEDQGPPVGAEPEPEPEEVLSDSTLSPSAHLSPALGGLRGRAHLAADSEAEAATASDSSTGPEWCVVKEGRRGGGEAAPRSRPPPAAPAPPGGDGPGCAGGDTPPPDGAGVGEEEVDDDIDEDWGEL